MGRGAYFRDAAADRRFDKREIVHEMAFGRRHRTMHRGSCSLSRNPEARRQGLIEFDGHRRIDAGASIPGIVNASDIGITCDIVNARSTDPPRQLR